MLLFAQIVFGLTVFGIIGALILLAILEAYYRIRAGEFLSSLGYLWVALFFISWIIIGVKC